MKDCSLGLGTTARLNTSRDHGFERRLCIPTRMRPSITLGVLLSVSSIVTIVSRFRLFGSTTFSSARCCVAYPWLSKHLSLVSVQIYWIECLVDVGRFKCSYTFWIPSHTGTTKLSVYVSMPWGVVENIIGTRY